MDNLKIVSCGAKYKHNPGFIFHKSTYPDCYVFAFFHTDFISTTQSGLRTGKASSYILHTPNSDVYHANVSNSDVGFTNDWMYLKGDYVDSLVKNMNILTNVIVPAYGNNSITKLIYKIQDELSEENAFKPLYLKVLITELFIELARNNGRHFTPPDANSFEIIRNARKIFTNDYSKPWTLESIANLSNLSKSHFLKLYKEYYKTTPIDDLIDYRISQAKFMLESNMLNINEISEKCGFNTPYYFSRMFKKKTGFSPSAYKTNFYKNI